MLNATHVSVGSAVLFSLGLLAACGPWLLAGGVVWTQQMQEPPFISLKKKELEFGCNLMSCSLVKKTDWKVE
jgi:hypothetical protein